MVKILDTRGLSALPLYDSVRSKRGKARPASNQYVGDFDGYPLQASREKVCFRIFSRHAFFSYRQAVKSGWLPESELPIRDFSSPAHAVDLPWLQTRATILNSFQGKEVNLDEYLGIEKTF